MKLSKNNTVYAAVLGLGVLALGIDKLLLGGGPAEAMAESPAAQPTRSTPAVGTPARPIQSIADQLEALRLAAPARLEETDADAFGLPPALAGAVEEELRRQAEERERAAREREAEELVRSLRLTAVRIPRDGTAQALINGRLLSLNADVPGTAFRLVEITKDRAILEAAGGTRITLSLRPEAAP